MNKRTIAAALLLAALLPAGGVQAEAASGKTLYVIVKAVSGDGSGTRTTETYTYRKGLLTGVKSTSVWPATEYEKAGSSTSRQKFSYDKNGGYKTGSQGYLSLRYYSDKSGKVKYAVEDNGGEKTKRVFTYDKKGRLTKMGEMKISYNAKGKISRINGTGDSRKLSYDAKGGLKMVQQKVFPCDEGAKPFWDKFRIKNTYEKGLLKKQVLTMPYGGAKKETVYTYKKVSVAAGEMTRAKRQQEWIIRSQNACSDPIGITG